MIAILADGIRYEIDKRAFTIGRAAKCDVVIDDPTVLPVHATARLRRRGDTFVLVLECNGDVRLLDGVAYDGRDVPAWTGLRVGAKDVTVQAIDAPSAWWNPGAWFGAVVKRRLDPVPPDAREQRIMMNPRTPTADPEPVPTLPQPPPPLPPPTVNPPPPTNPPPAPQLPPKVAHQAPSDPTEAALLDAVLRDPADEGARMVYADWLEQHGDTPAAQVVRGDVLSEIRTFAWRAVVVRTAIACDEEGCPATWDRVAPVEGNVALRSCATCAKQVVYCRKQSGDGYYARFNNWRLVVDR